MNIHTHDPELIEEKNALTKIIMHKTKKICCLTILYNVVGNHRAQWKK